MCLNNLRILVYALLHGTFDFEASLSAVFILSAKQAPVSSYLPLHFGKMQYSANQSIAFAIFPGQICSVTICVPLSCLNSVTTHTHTLTLGMHKNHNADAFFVRLYPFRVLPFFCNFLLILDDSHQKFDVEMRD